MKKICVWVLIVVSCFFAFHINSLAATDIQTKTGWVQEGGYWYYYNGDSKQTGWLKVGSTWYYFNSNGVMTTGWQKINGIWYYFQKGGAMTTGWAKIDNIWYYFGAGGAMSIGWKYIDNIWYYFGAGGAMQTGWLKLNGTWYYLGAGGAMQTGWQKINNKWYCFKPSGAMCSREWYNGYYLNEDGSWTYPYRGKWESRVDEFWFFSDTSGWRPKSESAKINDVIYTFDSNGIWHEHSLLEKIGENETVANEMIKQLLCNYYYFKYEKSDNSEYYNNYLSIVNESIDWKEIEWCDNKSHDLQFLPALIEPTGFSMKPVTSMSIDNYLGDDFRTIVSKNGMVFQYRFSFNSDNFVSVLAGYHQSGNFFTADGTYEVNEDKLTIHLTTLFFPNFDPDGNGMDEYDVDETYNYRIRVFKDYILLVQLSDMGLTGADNPGDVFYLLDYDYLY